MAGTPIDGKPAITTIIGTERVAVSAGTDTGGVGAGATDRKTTWNKVKEWIESNFAGVFNSIQFNPQTAIEQPYVLGKMFYDSDSHTWTAYTDIPGVSLQIGEELRGRLTNDTGGTLFDGKAVSVLSGSGTHLIVELLDASKIDSSLRATGIITADVLNGADGYAVNYGIVRDIDTNIWEVGDVLWGDPDNPGDLINVRPRGPNYPIRIGTVLVKSATVGSISVDMLAFNGSDTSVNLDGFLDGIVTQTPDVAVSVDTGVIYADVTNEAFPTKNLPFIIDGVTYFLNTTTNTGLGGAARAVVPPGASDILKQRSFVYVTLVGTAPVVPTLQITTTPPAVPFARIGELVAFNAARTVTDGRIFNYRRSNNAISSLTEGLPGTYGLIKVLLNQTRARLGSGWLSGQDATPTINDTTIRVAFTAGKGGQTHESTLPAFDGLNYFIYNTSANIITYASSTNLTDITLTAAGASLLSNNRYYTIRLYYQLNSNGFGNSVIATRPLGFYTTLAEALSDPLRYTVSMNDTDIEENIYKMYDIVVSRTGTGGTTIVGQLVDLRTKLVGGAGGGGASGGAGTDDKVRVSANDTTNSYLGVKISVEGGGTTVTSPSGNEVLQINTKKVTSIASSATPTPTGDFKENELYITALATGATIAAPTGTPVNGNKLLIRIKDNATAQTLAFNAIFKAVGVTLPTTTVISKTMYLGCVYNSNTTKWDVNFYKLEDTINISGHVLQENAISVTTTRPKQNYVSANSEDVVTDNSGNESTDITPKLRALNDYNATGEAANSLIQRNATNNGYDVVLTEIYDGILTPSSEPNISSDSVTPISVVIPAGYRILSITVQETAGNPAGNISIGTAASGTQIVNTFTVGASADLLMTLVADYFSSTADTDMYVSSSVWGTGVIQLNFVFQKTI